MVRQGKVGIVFGAWDLIHPGYVILFEESKKKCDHLIVALQVDPTIDRPHKNKPVQSITERFIVLSSIKYIDEIVVYSTDEDLVNLLHWIRPNVRFLGTDYEKTFDNIVGERLAPIEYIYREHNWSTSDLRKRMKEENQ